MCHEPEPGGDSLRWWCARRPVCYVAAMRFIAAGIGLALTVFPGGARAFVPPQTLVGGGAHRISTTGGSGDSHASLSSVAAVAEATRWRSAPATASGKTAASGIIAAVDVGSATRVKTSLHARGGSDEDAEGGLSKTAAMSGVGSTGSNALLLVATVLVLKGLFLPEEIRHLSFCPTEDPIRGRDTLPWRMMIESGRECGTVPEVMFKYVTSPVAIPGTPEWGTMLNVKEDLAKDAWMEEANK